MKIDRRDFDALLRVAEGMAREVACELSASGPDEIQINPMLREKSRAHDRATRTIDRLKLKYGKG